MGGVSPLLFIAAFSYAPTWAGTELPMCPVPACTRRDSPFHRILSLRSASYLVRDALLAREDFEPPLLGRIIANDRPCRFCAIAVTLATHTCIWLRAQSVGGLSSAA